MIEPEPAWSTSSGYRPCRRSPRPRPAFASARAVPCAALGENAALKKAWPGVVEAANLIGSDQIQGRCTIVGNLCNASPAADSVPAMVAAGAKAAVVGPKGKRTIAVEDVVTGPGKTSLKKGEVIEAITLPKPAPKSGDAYLRFIPRTEMDIAVVSAGVCLTLGPKGVVKKARVALGAVAADRAAGAGRGQGDRRHQARRCGARANSPPRAKPRASRSTTNAARSNSEPRWRACSRAVRPESPISVQGDNDVRRNSRSDHDQRRRGRVSSARPRETLLDVLRNRLGLTGAKEGCGTGDCGACSVTVDGRLVCSCLVLGAEAEGREVTTVEGLSAGGKLHPLQTQIHRARGAAMWHLHAGLSGCGEGVARPQPRSRTKKRSATRWPATCAAAPDTTRSSAR